MKEKTFIVGKMIKEEIKLISNKKTWQKNGDKKSYTSLLENGKIDIKFIRYLKYLKKD